MKIGHARDSQKKLLRDAVEILEYRDRTNAQLQQAYNEEKTNFKVAMLIRQVREEAGLTQHELSRLIGSKQSVISRLEDSDYEGHSLSMLQKIAYVLKRRLEIRLIAADEARPLPAKRRAAA